MPAPQRMDKEKIDFILNNKDSMKQVEIAKILNTSATTVSQILKGKISKGARIDDGSFDEQEFFKHYSY